MPPFTPHNLYSEHHRWLQALLWRKLGNRFGADDLAQDIFEKVFRQGKYHQIEEPRAYLTTIANRVVFNHRRDREIERACLETLAIISDSRTATLEQCHILQQILRELDELLHQLNPKARHAFLLYQLDNLT